MIRNVRQNLIRTIQYSFNELYPKLIKLNIKKLIKNKESRMKMPKTLKCTQYFKIVWGKF